MALRRAELAWILAVWGVFAAQGAVAQDEPRVFVDENAVVIRDGAGGEIRIKHLSVSQLWPRQGDLIKLGRFSYYAYQCYLVEVDPFAGRVRRRITFPGRISELERREQSLVVMVELPFGKAFRREPFVYTPGSTPPTALPIDEDAIRAPMLDAHRIVPHFDIRGFTPEYKRTAAQMAIQEGVYDLAFKVNPTNPWFMFDKGVVLRHLERFEEARAAFRAAIAVEGAPPFDYLRMSALLAKLGEAAESDLAFERGYAEFVRAGLEPELIFSQRAFARYYAVESPGFGGPTAHAEAVEAARRAGDLDRVISLMERVWRLAPRCEQVGIGFAGLAELLQEHGRSAEAALWFARSREAARSEGPVGSRQGMYASAACLAALAIILISIAAKYFPLQRQALVPLGGWAASWRWPKERFSKSCLAYATRMEVAGVLLVAVAGFASAYFVVRGEWTTLRLRILPEEFKTGSLGHPNVLSLFETDKSPAGKLLYGIARQQAGQIEKAEEVYKSLLGEEPKIAAIAANNLGVMFVSQDEARFREALTKAPSLAEARYNVGEPVDSVRVSRWRKYKPEARLIALPDASILARAFSSVRIEGQDEPTPTAEQANYRLFWALTWVCLIVSALVALLSIPFLLIRQNVERPRYGAMGALAYVVPGTSARLAPVGGLMLVGWLYCFLTLVLLLRGEYASVPLPVRQAAEHNFGLGSGVVFPFESAMAILGPAAFAGIWVLNGLFIARANRATRVAAATPSKEPVAPPAPEVAPSSAEVPAPATQPEPAAPPAPPQVHHEELPANFSSRETVRAVPEKKEPPPEEKEGPDETKPQDAEKKPEEGGGTSPPGP